MLVIWFRICTLAANLDHPVKQSAIQCDLCSMTAGGELQQKVSGHFVHYSDEDTDQQLLCCCGKWKSLLTAQCSGGFANSAVSVFIFGDKYFLLSLGTICEARCFGKQPD